ncbi:DUF4926 domain-containing protein [Pseudomonas floridensis]|uniref:DUF4926 domain-containing protein n=1 Tax=Pseudomonas floridensis TaxID=1958950 RepID=A0A1X0N5C7_9PSED|nr:DUF4926 domain-containing protein [Pseudomonas floridensis]
MDFRLLDVVRLEVDVPDEGLLKGTTGTIVHEFFVPDIAHEVEFTDSQGRTTAQLTLLPSP